MLRIEKKDVKVYTPDTQENIKGYVSYETSFIWKIALLKTLLMWFESYSMERFFNKNSFGTRLFDQQIYIFSFLLSTVSFWILKCA